MMFPIRRRSFLTGSCTALIVPYVQSANAAPTVISWPTKPVRLVVGYPPGGSVDNAARLLATALSARLTQPVIVENRVGADGTIAANAVLHSAADGHTLLVSLKGAMTVAPSISKLGFDPVRDLLPLAPIAQTSEIFVARPLIGITTLGGFADAMKRNGGKLSIGYIGAYPRLLAELLSQKTPGALLTVPYKGLPQAMQDLLGDQIDMLVGDATGLVSQQIRAGKVIPLGVTADRRLKNMPNVPTVREAGMPELTGMQWYALFGPVGISPQLANTITEAVDTALSTSMAKTQIDSFGLEPLNATPADLKRLMLTETEFWKKVAHKANITAE
jgi:tripartite-type tricarboxylate transporter receptor subunit TctC